MPSSACIQNALTPRGAVVVDCGLETDARNLSWRWRRIASAGPCVDRPTECVNQNAATAKMGTELSPR
jgi:hypothetical protein